MKLSTRARYGLRAMIELAQNLGEAPIMMRFITEKQGISRKYLHSLMTTLKSAGLVRSVRGNKGGYALARPASEIQVSEVIRVLEGSLTVVEVDKLGSTYQSLEQRVTQDVWEAMNQAIEQALDNLSLEDLVTRKREKEGGSQMYHI